MRVTLIVPPKRCIDTLEDRAASINVGLPLGVMYVASFLEKNGHKVTVVDCLIDEGAKFRKIDEKWARFGISEERILEKIKESRPEIIGISGQFTAQIGELIEVSKIAKKYDDKIPIMVGGAPFARENTTFMEKNPTVDIVVIGEGEHSALEIVDSYKNKKFKNLGKIKGVCYRKGKEIIKNELRPFNKTLDELPIPAYHLIDMNAYFDLPKRGVYNRSMDMKKSIPLVTSRGCPFGCVFCAIHLHMGRVWRAHSAKYVLEHIKFLKEKYGVEHINFEDDNLTLNQKRFEEIVDGIINNNYNITWDTPNGVRADCLNEELIRKMKKSGCVRLIVAPESGDQKILTEVVKKKLDLRKVEEVARICKKEGLFLSAFYVIGFPGETKKNIQNTVDFALRMMRKYDVSTGTIMTATPFKGTELYDICVENNYLTKEVTPENLHNSLTGLGFIKTKEFTPEDLVKIKKKFVRKAYLYSIPRHLKHPMRLINKIKNKNLLKIALMKFFKPKKM